jgi:hypothetical protein
MKKSIIARILSPLALFALAAFVFIHVPVTQAQTATTPVPACYLFNTNLTIGSTGADVTALQKFLISKGYSLPTLQAGFYPYGYFGVETRSAVMKYQTSIGIEATGLVGPLTRASLNACGGSSYPFGDTRLQAELIGVTSSSGRSRFEPATSSMSFNFTFKITALNEDVYISSTTLNRIGFSLLRDGSVVTDYRLQSGIWNSTSYRLTSDGFYKIEAGQTHNFETYQYYEGFYRNTIPGVYQGVMSSISWKDAQGNDRIYSIGPVWKSQNIDVQGGAVPATTTTPSITVLSPSSGPLNSPITITGSNFTLSGNGVNTTCPLPDGSSAGASAISVLSFDGKNIYTTLPSSFPIPVGSTITYPWNCKVNVSNTYGISNSIPFTITSPTSNPSITTVAGKAAGNFEIDAGGAVYIQGTNLAGYKDSTNVYIGGTMCTISQLSSTQIVCTASPALQVGMTYDLYVNSFGSSGDKVTSNIVKVKVLSQLSTNFPPVINGITSPTVLKVNEAGTWTVSASDPENGSLSYSIDWGDTATAPRITAASIPFVQTSTFTHSYATAGTYTVKVTVTDAAGLKAQTSSTVRVDTVVSNPSINDVVITDILTKNVTTSLQKGRQYGIRWSQQNINSPIYVYLLKLEGSSWNKVFTITTITDSVSSGTNSIVWTPPLSLTVDTYAHYKIYVETTGAGGQQVISFMTETTPVVFCPVGYICTPAGQPTACPVGNICTLTTVSCPSGYTCYSLTPQPVINSINPQLASIGTTVEINGKAFSGFESDKYAWIENSSGQKGVIYNEPGSSDNLIRFKLVDKYCTSDTSYSGRPCPSYINIVPGTYQIYVSPWGNMSNRVPFVVVSTSTSPTTTHSITPSTVTVTSGGTTQMKFTVPSSAISSKLYMYCPPGLSINMSINRTGGAQVCNVYTEMANTASENTYDFYVANKSTTPLTAAVNFYIYKADRPTFGIGTVGAITVNPAPIPVTSPTSKINNRASIWDAVRNYLMGTQ